MSRVYKKVQNRKFTHEKWSELNPVLLEGEVIFVVLKSDVKVKIGDGITDYINLPYADESTINEILLLKDVDKEIRQELNKISEELKKKISASFSTSDAGKVLGIDDEGNVVAVESLTSDATWGQLAGSYEILDPSETTNLGLKKMGYDEIVDVKDLNRNFDIIDSLDADIDANTANIANIQEELGKKVSAEFSKADSGKVLGINEAGEVVAVDAPLKGNVTWGELMGVEGDINPGETESLKLKKFDFDDKVNIETLNANYDLIDGLNNRVSNLLSALESFEGCGSELEVQDIRNGYDGQTYATAGDAVRALGAEILDISSKLQTINPNDLGLYQDEVTGMVYPVFKNQVSINGIPLSAYGGGGGTGGSGYGSTDIKLRRYPVDSESAYTVGKDTKVVIPFTFNSVDKETGENTGNGQALFHVNGENVNRQSIKQGYNEFDASEYLSLGNNVIVIEVRDAYDNVAKLTWEIEVVELTIASSYEYKFPCTDGRLTFKYTAYGDVQKTVHFLIDKVEVMTEDVETDGKIRTVYFENLEHGLHTLEVYSTAVIKGSLVESNHLKYDVMVILPGKVTPVISINYNVEEVVQGTVLEIPYIVIDPTNSESEITLAILVYEDGRYKEWYSDKFIVNQEEKIWKVSEYPAGDVMFSVSLRDTTRSIPIKVKKFDLPISPVKNDLVLHLSAEGRSNNEVNPAKWEYEGITTDFHNVNWASSGWISDKNGNTALRLMGGATATINYKPFAEDLRRVGRTIEFEFAIRNVNNRDAKVISCRDKDGVGFEITADAARMFSKSLTSNESAIECRFGDERKMRVAFTISSVQDYHLASIYIDGVLTHCTQYAESDNWEHWDHQPIKIGSPYCCVDLYNVRVYSDSLTHENLVNNYICDLPYLEDKRTQYNKNDLYDNKRNLVFDKVKTQIPTMTITGELPPKKGVKKDVIIDYHDPVDPTMSFSKKGCKIDVQGTSSQGYRVKNYKLKFTDFKYAHIKNGIATKTYCMKADYAEATSTHNTGIANLAHTLYSEPIPPQEADERCRTTIQGFPCVIFHRATENDEPRFVGKYNFNFDKGSEEAFGFTEDYDVESWEFCKNDEKACNFKDYIMPYYKKIDAANNNAATGWCQAFERRYPDHDEIDEAWENGGKDETAVEANTSINRFKVMHDWVVSTKDWDLSDRKNIIRVDLVYDSNGNPIWEQYVDENGETHDVLDDNGQKVQKKKNIYKVDIYREEFVKRFNLHYTLVYYVWTFFFLMVDQRAKNLFLTYWGKTGKWYPYLYDNDKVVSL